MKDLSFFQEFMISEPEKISGGVGKVTGSSRSSGFGGGQTTIDIDYGTHTTCGTGVQGGYLDGFENGNDTLLGSTWP